MFFVGVLMFAQGTIGAQSVAVCEGLDMTDWVVDLDGVMWRGKVPIDGSADAIATLLERGDRVLFCTNNSMESGVARAERLIAQGIPVGCEVVTSADAVCSLVRGGERVLVVGGAGLSDALAAHGAIPTAAVDVDPAPIVAVATERSQAAASQRPFEGLQPYDIVVVGLSRDFDYRQLDSAAAAVRAGARLVATNDDLTFPGADGIHPGAGSLVAAVEAAAGETATVAGKPLAPMCEQIVSTLDLGPAGSETDHRGDVIVVGDRPETDGMLAANLGVRFALVLSGVTARRDLPVAVPTAFVADDLASLVTDVSGSVGIS